jgi:hypothetical protein
VAQEIAQIPVTVDPLDHHHGVDGPVGQGVAHPHPGAVALAALDAQGHAVQAAVQVQIVDPQRLLERRHHRAQPVQALGHAQPAEVRVLVQPAAAGGVGEGRNRVAGPLRIGQPGPRAPLAQRFDQLDVVRALLRAERQVGLQVLHAEQAQRPRRGVDLALGVGELAIEAATQPGLGAVGGQGREHPGQAVVERQLLQRPARAAGLPGRGQGRTQRRRHRIAGEALQVVVAQVPGEHRDRLFRLGGGLRRRRPLAGAQRQRARQQHRDGGADGTGGGGGGGHGPASWPACGPADKRRRSRNPRKRRPGGLLKLSGRGPEITVVAWLRANPDGTAYPWPDINAMLQQIVFKLLI